MGEPPEGLLCRSYTHARTHPMVVGKIGKYTLPFQLSPAQVLALLGSFFVLLWTRRIWAHLPGLLNLLVQVAVPVAIAWALRHLRMEGRSPLRMGYGVIAYAFSPKGGVVGGRPYREPGTQTLRGTRIFVAAGPPMPTRAQLARGRARSAAGGDRPVAATLPRRSPRTGARR